MFDRSGYSRLTRWATRACPALLALAALALAPQALGDPLGERELVGLADGGALGRLRASASRQSPAPATRARLLALPPGAPSEPGRWLAPALADPDPGVAATAVAVLLAQHGAAGRQALDAMDAGKAARLEAARQRAATIEVIRELDAVTPADGWVLGTYPGQLDQVLVHGRRAVRPLLGLFARSLAGRRPSARALMAGEALGRLAHPDSAADLRRIYDGARWRRRGMMPVAELAMVALANIPEPDGDRAMLDRMLSYYERRASSWRRNPGEFEFRRGRLLERSGEPDQAMAAYSRALSLGYTRRLSWCHYNLCAMHASQGRLVEARLHLAGALRAGLLSRHYLTKDTRLAELRKDSIARKLIAKALREIDDLEASDEALAPPEPDDIEEPDDAPSDD